MTDTRFPGFADPVLDAQAGFRALLEAMSRPGRVRRIVPPPAVPDGISPAAAAVLLTLVDATTPLRLGSDGAVRAWVRFHCGCPLVRDGAAFVLDPTASLRELEAGTDEEPQGGATLVLEVESLEEATGWRLTGPGIRDAHDLRVIGVAPGFVADWAWNRARFPRGVDAILCAGDRIAAVPRTVLIEEA
jgi:alpha-D-ribose 1-methylphosphonate 5-triphosphate synthase subunit PhnH